MVEMIKYLHVNVKTPDQNIFRGGNTTSDSLFLSMMAGEEMAEFMAASTYERATSYLNKSRSR